MKALDSLARLLATENLQVVRGNYDTASFDCLNRILRIPNWDYLGKDASDLFVSHEVGHALWTPVEAIDKFKADPRLKGCPFSTINILEDVRIERMIQNKYPGLIAVYRRGYAHLLEIDLFRLGGQNIGAMSFFNRLNLYAKIGVHAGVDVPMSDDEMKIYRKAYATETIDDVLNLAAELWKPIREKKEKQEKEDEVKPTAPSQSFVEGEGEGEKSAPDFQSPGGEAGEESDDKKGSEDKDSLSSEGKGEKAESDDSKGDDESEGSSDSTGDDNDSGDASDGNVDSDKQEGNAESKDSSDKRPDAAKGDTKPTDDLPELSEDDFSNDATAAEARVASMTEERRLTDNVVIVTSDFSYALKQVVIPYEKCRKARADATMTYWGKIG